MSIYGPLEEMFHIPQVLQAAVLAIGILVLGGLMIRRQIAAAGGGVLPDEGVTLRNFAEVVVEGLANLARDVMGDEWRRYFPLVGAIFVFILVSMRSLARDEGSLMARARAAGEDLDDAGA